MTVKNEGLNKKQKTTSHFSNPLLIPFILLTVIIAYLLGNINYLKQNDSKQKQNSRDSTIPECNLDQTKEKVEKCTVLIKTNWGSGTGIILNNGYIITNRHVIERSSKIKVIDYYNNNVPVTFWNYSQTTDLALLKLEKLQSGCDLNLQRPEKGEVVVAIGYPDELYETNEATFAQGIISKFVFDEVDNELIKTDTPINPGNSGGPLTNACGIIGINTLKFYGREERQNESVGYAISSNTISNQLNKLMESGGDVSIPQIKYEPSEFTDYYDEIPTDINGLTQEQIQIYANYKNNVKILKNAWDSYTGSDFDNQTVTMIKDLVTRIANVTENIFPKIANHEKLNTEETEFINSFVNMYSQLIAYESSLNLKRDSLGYYYYKCNGVSCIKSYGIAKNQCSSSYDCIPKKTYHYECVDMTCRYVEGDGESTCYFSSDCYHYICDNMQCKKVEGKGTDECYSDYSCYHNECQNGSCVKVPGSGTSTCYSDYSCQ